MPRLLVSSLPPDITTGLLTDILSRAPVGVSAPAAFNGIIPRPTDIKVLMTKQGRSRRMAFVGYKTDAEAAWAKDTWQGVWVNGTAGHASGNRIEVEWAKSVEESNVEKTSGKRVNPSQSTSATGANKRQKGLVSKEKESDPNFQAFLSTMQPRQHKSLVDDILEVPILPSPQSTSLPSVSVPVTSTKKADQLAPQPALSNTTLDLHRQTRDATPDAPPVIGDDDDLTEKEYMARRMKRAIGGLNDADSSLVPSEQPSNKEWDQGEVEPASTVQDDKSATVTNRAQAEHGVVVDDKDTDEGCILQTGRLFLRNLPFSVAEEDLMSLFSPLGEVSQVHIPLSHDRKPKGVAYVTFARPSDALTAFKKLDQHDFQGRLLHILPAVTRNSRPENDSSRLSKNVVKQEKDVKRKLESSKQFNWASLYMNSDAVATSVADRLKISKAELFDPDAQNPSVKLALAETQVITETKQYFEEQGIDTEAFNDIKAGRSPTIILVKNIPYGTTSSILRGLFGQHGEVSRILMPPCGTIALVEMSDADDARGAFKSLAYKRIGNSVLYLEKAPAGIWKKNAPPPPTSDITAPSVTPTSKTPSVDEGEPGSTLFVKNISYSTTPDGLSSVFRNLPDFLFARIQTKPDPKNPINRLSMGFGFVGFKTVEAARHALKAMQSYRLDAHALELKFAKRGRDEEDEEKESKPISEESGAMTSTKLLVKNVPFETSKKELQELFSAYGKLKSVRLPKKIDRKTRGFGFIEYTTKKEAEEAMKSLKHTHLLGRHLIISYANDKGEDLEQLRLKSGGNFLINQVNLQKTKFNGLKGDNDNEVMRIEDD